MVVGVVVVTYWDFFLLLEMDSKKEINFLICMLPKPSRKTLR